MDSRTEQTSPLALDPAIEIGGERYMRDASGRLVPEQLVSPIDKLIDETVRKIVGYAEPLSAQIARFKAHTMDDVGALQDLLAEQYSAKIGGAKGNVSLTSHDGTLKVTVQVQDHLTFGPELQVAKALVDECIGSWSEGARPEIRALVEHAFQVDKEGRINRSALFQLRRVQIKDEKWQEAMRALGDSMRTIGTSTYIRFHRRNRAGKFEPITIDIAAA